MEIFPKSPSEMVGGLRYFGRMLDKIRLRARGDLHSDYHANLGHRKAADGVMCNFLRIDYEQLRQRVLEGGSDEEILEWCFVQGHRPNEMQVRVWNAFAEKLGWRDPAARTVARVNQRLGLGGELATIFECIDADEGRFNQGNKV